MRVEARRRAGRTRPRTRPPSTRPRPCESHDSQDPDRVGVLLVDRTTSPCCDHARCGRPRTDRATDAPAPVGAPHQVDEMTCRVAATSGPARGGAASPQIVRAAGADSDERAVVATFVHVRPRSRGCVVVPPAAPRTTSPIADAARSAPRRRASSPACRAAGTDRCRPRRRRCGGRRRAGGRSRSGPGWCPGTRRRGCAGSAGGSARARRGARGTARRR